MVRFLRSGQKNLVLYALLLMVLPVGEAFGDLIIAGRVNNTPTDSFTFFSLRNLTAGETFYFTDNGWTGSAFRGASATDGDGNENLIRFTANASINAGTLINSTAANANWSWTTSGAIPGTTSGSFAHLALGQGGEQIYAFSAPSNNPLLAPSSFHFVFDDTNGFENASSSSTGSLPAGAVGVSINASVAGGVILSNDGLSRTAAGWQTYATNASNWVASANINSTGNFSITAVPEPTSMVLVTLVGVAGVAIRARRRKTKIAMHS